MSVIVNQEALKVCAPFQSGDAARYYLNGVLFSKGRLVATDGHRMAVIKPAVYEGEAEDFILPRDCVALLCRVKPDIRHQGILIELDGEKAVAFQKTDNERRHVAMFFYKPVDATFPEWQRVLPDPEEMKCIGDQVLIAAFDTAYLADFKVFGKNVSLHMNGDARCPIIVRADTDSYSAVGLLMPVAGEKRENETLPAWVKE